MAQGTNGAGTKALLLKLGQMHGKKMKVGWFEGAKEDDGTPSAYVAAINEHGYAEGGIPARPFMRPTAAEKRGEWVKKYAALLKKEGPSGVSVALDAMGVVIAADFKKTIADLRSPRLANSTIQARIRRGGLGGKKKMPTTISKPLVDTRMMLSTLTAVVEGGKK